MSSMPEQPADYVAGPPEPVLTLRLYQQASSWRGTLHQFREHQYAEVTAPRWRTVLAMLQAALEEVLPSDGDEDGV